MENKIEMTAKQLASIDLLIAKKKEFVAAKAPYVGFTDEVAANLANVAAGATVAAIAVGAAATALVACVGLLAAIGATAVATAVATRAIGSNVTANEKAITEIFEEMARNVSLDGLIELRKMAILKK
jgi:hypothetical protein